MKKNKLTLNIGLTLILLVIGLVVANINGLSLPEQKTTYAHETEKVAPAVHSEMIRHEPESSAVSHSVSYEPIIHQEVHHEDSHHESEHLPAHHHDETHQVHHEESYSLLTPQQSSQAYLPLWIILIPLMAAVLVVFFHRQQVVKNFITVGCSILVFGLILLMFQPVISGLHLGDKFYKGLYFSFPLFPGFEGSFKVDPAGLLLAAITSFLWIISTIHALSYMTIEGKRTRYDFFVLLSLAMNLGVLLAGDFLTLFFFFEGMVLFPYALIAHHEDKKAIRGANMYLYLGAATSLLLLAGIFLLQYFTGSIAIGPMAERINATMPGAWKYLLAVLMIFGFGGKAGIFFEHIWLPQAHPVAPTPASALLSGAMIKAGAYGIFRVVNMIFSPENTSLALEWLTMRHIGYGMIWLGIMTMFLGVLNALISSNSKQMLAYHSVSQMGYIVMGIGCAAYLGSEGAMGLAGALYHIVNHALFKASLFLTVGAVYFRTHELDMYKLGGLWRNMPLTCVAMFIAVCGISGIPGFNGFASKTILHHSIVEAYQHSAHFTSNGKPDFLLRIAEILFMITAGGTFASNMKLWVLDFFKKRPEKYAEVKPAPRSMQVSLVLVSAAILLIGFFPNWLLEHFIGPALGYFGFEATSHPYHILYNTHIATGIRSTIPLLYDPVTKVFTQSSEVLHNLLGGGDALLFGGMIFILGFRFGWFHIEVPKFLTVEYYYLKIFHGFIAFCTQIFSPVAAVFEKITSTLMVDMWVSSSVNFMRRIMIGERHYDQFVDKLIYGKSILTFIQKMRGEGEDKYEQYADIWDRISLVEGRYDDSINKIIYSKSILSLINKLSNGEKEKYKEIWDRISTLEDKYDKSIDKIIYSKSILSLINKLSDEEKGKYKEIWELVSELEGEYDKSIDKIIYSKGIQELIKEGKFTEEEICHGLVELGEKYREVLEEELTEEESKKRKKGIWKWMSQFDSSFYDTFLERVIFGFQRPGDKEAEETRWFYRLCKQISSVHSGDLSTYISWIVVGLSLIIAILIGSLYITSFLTVLILITAFLLLIGVIALLMPKKTDKKSD